MIELLSKHKSALFFLTKFLVLYIILNVIYGVLIQKVYPRPDYFTEVATIHTSKFLNLLGFENSTESSVTKPNVLIKSSEEGEVLSVYEGCNGVNVLIIFLAFLFAFKIDRRLFWFIPLGSVIIHLLNIFRISVLYFVSIELPQYLYFSHKYLLTAFIFMVIFVLWYWWVRILKVVR